jgi:hypothetical protein
MEIMQTTNALFNIILVYESVYFLFNTADVRASYAISNYTIINENKLKECRKSLLWLNLNHYPGICVM